MALTGKRFSYVATTWSPRIPDSSIDPEVEEWLSNTSVGLDSLARPLVVEFTNTRSLFLVFLRRGFVA